jgi:hypothetical protein
MGSCGQLLLYLNLNHIEHTAQAAMNTVQPLLDHCAGIPSQTGAGRATCGLLLFHCTLLGNAIGTQKHALWPDKSMLGVGTVLYT